MINQIIKIMMKTVSWLVKAEFFFFFCVSFLHVNLFPRHNQRYHQWYYQCYHTWLVCIELRGVETIKAHDRPRSANLIESGQPSFVSLCYQLTHTHTHTHTHTERHTHFQHELNTHGQEQKTNVAPKNHHPESWSI